MIIVRISIQEELIEILTKNGSSVIMGNWKCSEFPTLFLEFPQSKPNIPLA